MDDARDRVIDLVAGRWRSRTLYAGVELGVFEVVGDRPKHAIEIADQAGIDRELGYRLLRALGSLGLLEEGANRRFTCTPAGRLLTADHPESLRGLVRLEEGPTHDALWRHLADVVREGEPGAFGRAFGHSGDVHRDTDRGYATVVDEAMRSYARVGVDLTRELLGEYDGDALDTLCVVGEDGRSLLGPLLQNRVSLDVTTLDHGVGTAGRAPAADVYLVAPVLHGYSDTECEQLFSTVGESAAEDARLFAIEHVVPGPERPHVAKLFDVRGLVVATGRERTSEEYASLLEASGWAYVDTHYPETELLGAIEAIPD